MPDRARAWGTYVDRFHGERPGITETLLSRSVDDTGRTPYGWVRSGLPAGLFVDLGCGSAPMQPEVTQPDVRGWVGVDRSRGELAAARHAGRGPVVAASADG